MAVSLKEKRVGTMVLIVCLGVLVGSYLSALIGLLPGGNNVVKTLFTYNFVNFGLGFPNAVLLDLNAIKLQLGFQFKFNILSLIGVFVSLYLFRWYR